MIRFSHIPTNMEIAYNEDLNNKLLIKVAKSKHLMLVEKKNNLRYKITLFNPGSLKKEIIEKDCDEQQAVLIINHATSPMARKSDKLADLAREFKSLNHSSLLPVSSGQ